MNRFTDITPSVYNPMTFEEIAMVPMMKRKQHDETLAKQELIRAGLAKVDPYDKHFNEAIRLKQEMESKMDNTSLELSKNGINNDMIGKTIALNRQFQDLTSPTGKIGQINAEKQNILKINEEYDKLGKEKRWGQDVIEFWKNKALKDYNEAPIYDKNGRILKYSGPEDIANKIDYDKYLNDLATNAKMSTTEFSKAVSGLAKDEESGYNVVNKSSYGYKLGDNYKAVKAAYDALKESMQDPTSEVARSVKYERRDPNLLLNILNTQSDVYKQSVNARESSSDINPFGSGPDKIDENQIPGIFGEDYNTQEVGGMNQDFSEIEQIGTSNKFSQPIDSKDTGANKSFIRKENSKIGKVFTYEDIKNPKQKALYDNAWKKATTEGIIVDGKKVNLTEEYIKAGKDNPKVAELLLKSMKQSPALTLTSKMLTTDRDLNNSGFGSSMGKTADERNKQMRKELQMTNQGARKLIDKDGKEYTFAEAQKKFGIAGTESVTYQGYVSPLNWEEHSFNGTNSKASPHVITVKTKDNEYIEFKTSRTNGDNAGINIKRFNDLNKNYRNYTINHDEFIPFESDSPSLKGFKIKYNTQNPKVDLKRGILNYEIIDKEGVPHYMSETEYIDTINSIR